MEGIDEDSDLFEIKLRRDLSDLQSCNLSDAWSYLKTDIEMNIGKNLICIPYLTDGHLYDIGSIFIKIEQHGARRKRFRTYKPLGQIENLIDKSKSNISWHNLLAKVPEPQLLIHPKTFKLTIYDDPHQRKVRVVATNFYKQIIPEQDSPIGNVTLNQNKSEDLKHARTIYLVNDVISAQTVELRINVEEYERIFHLDYRRPIVFSYQKYTLSNESAIVAKKSTAVCSARAKWTGFELRDKDPYAVENFTAE